MYNQPNYQPWFGPPYPTPPPVQPSQNPVELITGWIRGLEELKKSMKEEKKDDPKKKSGDQTSLVGMMLFMLLVSPISGPLVFWGFQHTLNLLK